MKFNLALTLRSFIALAVISSANPASEAYAFGGEDLIEGNPWHHYDMTVRALTGDDNAGVAITDSQFSGVGFAPAAAKSIAWHSDYIDSYLYNPLWWLEGAPDSARFKTAIAMFDHLAALHHDDTFSSSGIKDNWIRYTSGVLTGLYWAAEQGTDGDVAAAHNILGVAFHANQDFYSHTNWMNDPQTRNTTWLRMPPSQRDSLSLYSGAYELTQTLHAHHHGAYSVSCTILRNSGKMVPLAALCGGLSPFQNASPCQSYRACRADSTAVNLSAWDNTLSDVVYLNPTGMALDNTWLTKIGGEKRGLTNRSGHYIDPSAWPDMDAATCNGIINFGVQCEHSRSGDSCARVRNSRSCRVESDYLFAAAKRNAILSTSEYATLIETAMRNIVPTTPNDKYERFWDRVKNEGSTLRQRTAQFEDFAQVPFQFLSAGKYPIANPATRWHPSVASSDGWYLRLKIKTSSAMNAGTDGDVYAQVNGSGWQKRTLLDYSPTSDTTPGHSNNRFFVYNDFEAGDKDTYTVGPFRSRPLRITLINDSADAEDVVEAVWHDFTDTMETFANGLRHGFLALIGGNADFVGSVNQAQRAPELFSQLMAAPGRSLDRSLSINAGDEGRYRLHYRVRIKDDNLTAEERRQGWHGLEYTLTSLQCIEESFWDRGSNSDEPFFFFSVSPLNGETGSSLLSYPSRVFDDVDDGERRSLNARLHTKIPPNGGISLTYAHYENDDESAADRRSLYTTFRTGLEESERRANTRFLDALGRSLAADWEVDEMTVFPFKRGALPAVGAEQTFRNIGVIEGDGRRSFALSGGAARPLINGSTQAISQWQHFSPLVVGPILNFLLPNNPQVVIPARDLQRIEIPIVPIDE